MAEDSDSDVVFENSPLHLHLKDCGIENSVYETKTMKTEGGLPTSCSNKSLQPAVHQSIFKKLNEIFLQKLLKFVIYLFWEESFKVKMISQNKKLLSNLIMNSNALIEDDLIFLENVLDSKTEVLNFDFKIVSLKSQILMTLIVPNLAAFLFYRVVHPELFVNYKFLTDTIFLLLFLYCIYFCVQCLICKFRRSYFEKQKEILSDILGITDHLIKSSEKSLRLIQEAELVTRGFTLISHKNPIWRLEQGNLQETQRQCPQLRQCLFHVVRETMLIFKAETSDLLSNFPIKTEIGNVINYLACIPLKEYGDCLRISGHDSESSQELFKVTDGYSVAALKGMRQLYILQQSEYFRRLSLTYEECDNDCFDKVNVIYLSKLKTRLTDQLKVLQRSLESHSSVLVNKEPKMIKMKKEHKSSLVNDLYTAVHSLDLHLQSALLRVRTLEEILQQNIEDEDISSTTMSEENFKELVIQIRQELYACKGCWEEGLNRLEKMEKKESKVIQNKMTPTSNYDCTEMKKENKLIGMSDPVIEDEVFEAYIHEQEEFEQNSVWDDFLTPEEKARKKREKEEALRVLSELKNVISHRAVEREKREALALQRSTMKYEISSSNNKSISCLINDQEKHCVDHIQSKGETAKGDNLISEYDKIKMKTTEKSGEYLLDDDFSNNGNLDLHSKQNDQYKQKEKFEFQDLLSSKTQNGRRLDEIPPNSLSFTANLAALVASRSQMLGLEEQTFGDDDDDDDDGYDNDVDDKDDYEGDDVDNKDDDGVDDKDVDVDADVNDDDDDNDDDDNDNDGDDDDDDDVTNKYDDDDGKEQEYNNEGGNDYDDNKRFELEKTKQNGVQKVTSSESAFGKIVCDGGGGSEDEIVKEEEDKMENL